MKNLFDGLKNVVEALSDVEHVKATFKEFKDGVVEDTKELLATNHTAAITGQCPICEKETGFRELSFSENVATVGKFAKGSAAQFIGGGLLGKAEVISKAAGHGDSRNFPNYVCLSCQRPVMQCSGCQEIVQYADTGESHVCGSSKQALVAGTAQERNPMSTSLSDDVISKLERLGSLKDRGLLTADEFDAQKRKLIG